MVDSDTLLVSGIAETANQNKATILRTVDGGLTWQRVFLASAPTSYCWKIFMRPDGTGISSVEMVSAIARTTDFGATWTEIPVNPPGYDFGAIGLLNDSLGWVTLQSNVGYSGTWQTTDGGLTWDSINTSIEAGDRLVVVDSVTALISGRGIFKYVYSAVGLHQSPSQSSELLHELALYPNPATDVLHIDAVAVCPTFGLLDILDEKGIIVQHITRQPFPKGKSSFTIPIKSLRAANYKLLWRTNEVFITRNFIAGK